MLFLLLGIALGVLFDVLDNRPTKYSRNIPKSGEWWAAAPPERFVTVYHAPRCVDEAVDQNGDLCLDDLLDENLGFQEPIEIALTCIRCGRPIPSDRDSNYCSDACMPTGNPGTGTWRPPPPRPPAWMDPGTGTW